MYVSLHNHTAMGSNTRGFLDSINRVEDLIDYTFELGHKGVAITDHDCITAHMDAVDYINSKRKEAEESGDEDLIKRWNEYRLILGNEIYLCSRKQIEEDKEYKFWHFILLSKDIIGHKQIRELSTRAWTQNAFTWVNIRTPTFYDDLFEIVENDRGHLMSSTSCLGGFGPKLILDAYNENPNNPDYSLVKKWLNRMLKCFGEGNFFLELQPSIQEDQRIVNLAYLQLSKELNIPYIITVDAHYLKKEDRPIHEAFLKSNEDSGKDREVGDFYATTYIMSEEEIHEHMDEYMGYEVVQLGLDNTILAQKQVQEYNFDKPLDIPYEPDNIEEPDEKLYNKYAPYMEHLSYFYNSSHPSDRHLVREIVNKIEEKPEELANQKTYDAINTCLNVIKNTSEKMGTQWSAYLIQTRAFVDAIWACDSICGPSRGCFVPGTKILMADGTQKNIEDVKIGDKVISHLGYIREVKNTFSYDIEEEIYTIKGRGGEPVQCTNNHKFYMKECKKCENPSRKQSWCTERCKSYNKKCSFQKTQEIKWIEAQNIEIGDMLSYPKVKLSKQEQKIIDLSKYEEHGFFDDNLIWTCRCNHNYQPLDKHPRFIPIDKEFAYMAGVYLGDGWVRSGNRQEIGFVFNINSPKEMESKERIKTYWENMGYNIKEDISSNNSMIVLRLNKTYLHSFFKENFGNDAYDKKVPSFLLVDNPEIIGSLLEGLMNSDGSYDSKKVKRFCYDSVNYNLISQIRMLFGYMGLYGGIIERIPEDTREAFLNSKKSYKITYSGKQIFERAYNFLPWSHVIKKGKFATNYYVEDDNNFFFRTEFIEKSWYKGKVYDLNIDIDNSFVANNYCVHNSGAGFILLYILGITQINPLKEETPLYYWRFLHEYRASPLDVDLDCDGNKREEIVDYLKAKYGGYRRVFNVQTLLTVKSKNAIQIACRGLGIPSEEAQFLSSFIGQERGIQHSLGQTFYGDEKDNIPPNTEFANLMTNKYPEVWEVAQRIEGLVVGVGQHAGGVVLSSTDVVDSSALMRSSSGTIISQNDLHKIERESLIKWDLLGVDYCGKIKICLELLAKYGYIEWQESLKATYEKYIDVYHIERDNPEIWDMIDHHKIISLFQMEKQTGIQAISIAEPRSLIDLSALNSVMRLMAPEPGAESPLERYGRFRKDITLWYKEMEDYGLTEHEQQVVRKYAEKTYGLLPNQENFMLIVQDPEVGGFDLLWADRLRKSIA